MSAPPFAALAEAFLEDKFEIIEGELTFEAGIWFEILVTGITSTGHRYCEGFRDQEAIRLMSEMFAWTGES